MLPSSSFQICRVLGRNLIKKTADNVSLRASRSFTEASHVTRNTTIFLLKAPSILSSLKLDSNDASSCSPSLPSARLEIISPGLAGRVLELPRPSLTSLVLDLPPLGTVLPLEPPPLPWHSGDIREAPALSREEKQAARLIVIRRRMMKKHKLRKLRKKMKFEWAKVRQKREMRKEKAFQAVLLAQIREAEKFDAKAYVTEKLRQANEVPLPRHWKGRRLPEFLIKQYMGIK